MPIDKKRLRTRAFNRKWERTLSRSLLTLQRPSFTKGPTGGNVPGEPTVLATNRRCIVRTATGKEIQVAGATQGSLTMIVETLAWDGTARLQIDSSSQLVVTGEGQESQILQIVAPLPDDGVTVEIIASRSV